MKNFDTQNKIYGTADSYKPLIFGLVLWATGLLILFAIYWTQAEKSVLGEYYLLPWCFFTGVVILSPSFYLLYKGKFDFFHPLVFGSLSYLLPAFVIGGLILTFTDFRPFFFSFIENPEEELPLSLLYIAIGYIGMVVGYYSPFAKYLVKKTNSYLPELKWDYNYLWIGGILLVVAGFGINIWGLIKGIAGYQLNTAVEQFDGLLRFLMTLLTEGTVLLWLLIFDPKNKNQSKYILLILLILTIPLRVAILGSKASLLLSLLPILFAFNYSGRTLKFKHGVIFAILIIVGLFVGIIYGSTFRNIKGSEARVEVGDYLGQVSATMEYLSSAELMPVLEDSLMILAERVENISSLAVVVSNYEKLAPYEAAYGLENNIVNDTVYSLIPRFLWQDKPETSNTRAYSDLYFNFGENSYTVTPFGDLLRNFGVIGIPLGMMLVGIYLRWIYGVLIETETPAMWKKTVYFPLLTVISYESFYAVIFPSIFRVLFVVVLSVIILHFLIRKRSSSQ